MRPKVRADLEVLKRGLHESLQWRHNERDGVSNHRRLECLLNRLFRRRSDQRKHQSSVSLAFVTWIHRWPVDSPHKGSVAQKIFLFDDVIMIFIVCFQEPPFAMLKKDHEQRKGNDRFEGFAIEMMEVISQMLQFEYEFYVVHDGNFGIRLETGEWNGMIGEVLCGVNRIYGCYIYSFTVTWRCDIVRY